MGLTGPVGVAGVVSEEQAAWVSLQGKDEVVGVLLALFLGGFGAHHFYLRRWGLGVVYLLLSWTGIPFAVGWIECFLMPGRVRRYNAMLLATAAAAGGWRGGPAVAAAAGVPVAKACPACGATWDGSVRFCARCGAALG